MLYNGKTLIFLNKSWATKAFAEGGGFGGKTMQGVPGLGFFEEKRSCGRPIVVFLRVEMYRSKLIPVLASVPHFIDIIID